MKKILVLLIACLGNPAGAGEALPYLPPADQVARVLAATPTVQAAASQVEVEEANRRRLETGPHEWNLRLGGQQRKVYPGSGPDERFNEWNVAIERPLRLPGKGSLDAELGAAGVALAETGRGDAQHETSRNLLKAWFVWLKESASAAQWGEQLVLLEKQAKAVQRRQQLGDAARLEAIQSEAALAQALAQQAQAQVRQRIAADDLNRRFPGLVLAEPLNIAEPIPVSGTASEWMELVLEHSHELGMARGEVERARIFAGRTSRERLPDPTIGVHVSQERSGEEHILGAYISIPLPGGARRASADAALAQADAARYRETATLQKITAEAAALYHSASAAYATWQSARTAAERLGQAADMTARAYQLGEGSLTDLLAARRLANEAQLSARLLQLDAQELRYRLLLDAHQLWELDEDHQSGRPPR